MKCKNCQSENRQDAKFCISCGGSLINVAPLDDGIRKTRSTNNNVNKRYAQDKNPTLAAFLSFFLVGLGQIYNGDVLKGVVLFVAAITLSPTVIGAFGIWGFGIYDAYQVAKGNHGLWK